MVEAPLETPTLINGGGREEEMGGVKCELFVVDPWSLQFPSGDVSLEDLIYVSHECSKMEFLKLPDFSCPSTEHEAEFPKLCEEMVKIRVP
ncbi:hypothetical protein GIB67_010151 [Kingdonia uniflora]|uniref:Uncharacterized protein n=1 Tax=Kingdonia uniflora TaxID=39325 RepID=A0A7J7NAD1_9MAGN|nr:hypothetical protein GIB67_010151 [Kingdonia uniflora]